MTALGQTRTAAGYIAEHALAPLTRTRALLLGQQLTACADQPPSPGVLRQVVIAVRGILGAGWLAAHADEPGVVALQALDTTADPPPLPVLDQVLSHCLWARFGHLSSFAAHQAQAGL